MLSTERKSCTFDCVYCQLGDTTEPIVERREFVSIVDLESSLSGVKGLSADYATFSGMGEPTLAGNLGEAIELVRSTLRLPVAVLTNSSLIMKPDVRRDLARADVVAAKVDAPDEGLFRRINRPLVDCTLQDILNALGAFRGSYRGRLALQVMFIEANSGCAKDIAEIARAIRPDEVQINTPLRPCPVRPVSSAELSRIARHFGKVPPVVTVYEADKKDVAPLHLRETLRRRPRL